MDITNPNDDANPELPGGNTAEAVYMPNLYATIEQFHKRLANNRNPATDTELPEILEAASRAVDDYLSVKPAYFYPPTAISSKQILGGGASYLSLPAPLYGNVTVTAPSGVSIPDYDISDDLRLVILDATGNPNPYLAWERVYYTISGFWGYQTTPPQIREACLQLATHFYRGRDKALSGIVGDMKQDEQFPERDYPRQTRRILDEFKRGLGGKPGGGLHIA